MDRVLAPLVTTLALGCAAPAPVPRTADASSASAAKPPVTAAPGAAPTASATPPVAPVASAAVGAGPPPGATPCGDLECLAFASPRAAFEYATRGDPRVVAVGEAHAQKAAGNLESATRRFARELLPVLAPRAKGLIIELLTPDRRCEHHEEQAVAERTKPVTAPQAETNQNDFVALGFAAQKLGIKPEPLVPSCEELAQVLRAQQGDVAKLLELIAAITTREAVDFLDHRPTDQALAIYGGLLHNDVSPSPEHAAWSFGPRLGEHTRGSYVEVDLIVPELVRNEEPWTTLPWFATYAKTAASSQTLLYRTGPASYVLIFPKTATNPP